MLLVPACGVDLNIAVEAFERCMAEAGFPVRSVSVGERPNDGALSFGFTLEVPDNGALAASELCTERASSLVGRLPDF
jgi:hypothetical protein